MNTLLMFGNLVFASLNIAVGYYWALPWNIAGFAMCWYDYEQERKKDKVDVLEATRQR